MSIPKITISGQAKTGKSTIAMVIYKALKDAGINAMIHNEDTCFAALANGQPARLAALANGLNGQAVVIDQVHMPRTAPVQKVDSPLDREEKIFAKAARLRGEVPASVSTPAIKVEDELAKNTLEAAINNAAEPK